MNKLLLLSCLIATLAGAQSIQVMPPNTIACNAQISLAAPTSCTTVPPGVSMDVAGLVQSSPSDAIPFNLISGTTVAYPNGSLSITSANNGQVVNNLSASPATLTFPQVGSSGVVSGSFQTVAANNGAGLNTLTASGTSTINQVLANAYLPQYGWALTLTDNTTGNYVMLEAGGYQFNATGNPVFSTGIIAPGIIVNSTNCGASGARLALFGANGLAGCAAGSNTWTSNGSGDFTALSYTATGMAVAGIVANSALGVLSTTTAPTLSMVTLTQNIIASGSPPTMSFTTCTNYSAQSGGLFAFTFAATGSGACSYTATGLPAAPHGWFCDGSDLTSKANWTQGTTITTTSCTITGTVTTTGDIIKFNITKGF